MSVVEDLGDTPKRLAYADPPYPNLSWKYYRDEPTYDGEVDHGRLLEQLATYDGWALSTSRKALEDGLLSLIPRGVEFHLCAWTKTHYRCTRCGGTVDSHGHRWYLAGFEHGKAGSK